MNEFEPRDAVAVDVAADADVQVAVDDGDDTNERDKDRDIYDSRKEREDVDGSLEDSRDEDEDDTDEGTDEGTDEVESGSEDEDDDEDSEDESESESDDEYPGYEEEELDIDYHDENGHPKPHRLMSKPDFKIALQLLQKIHGPREQLVMDIPDFQDRANCAWWGKGVHSLYFGRPNCTPDNEPWRMPPEILQLEDLDRIAIKNCCWLPKGIKTLKKIGILCQLFNG